MPRCVIFGEATAEKDEEEDDNRPRQPQAAEPRRGSQERAPATPQRGEAVSPGQSVTDAISRAAKFKEVDPISVNGWPEPAGFRLWRVTLLDQAAVASAKPQRAFEWMLEVQNGSATFAIVCVSGDDVAALDAKLASALTRVVPSDFQRVLQAKKSDAMKTDKMLAGRQILFMIDRRFKMSEKVTRRTKRNAYSALS